MWLDGVAVRACRSLDFRNGAFAPRLRELQYLMRGAGRDERRACSSLRVAPLFGKEAYDCMVAADVLASLEYVDSAKLGGIGPAHN